MKKCEVCGQSVKVVGHTTMHYERPDINEIAEIDVDELRYALTDAHGCKPNGNDCTFSRCNSWGKCEQIIKAIAKAGILKWKQ